MESIDSKQKNFNKNLYDLYTFNINKPNQDCNIKTPKDTFNNRSQVFDTCKYSARNYDYNAEEKLRQKYAKINVEEAYVRLTENNQNVKNMDKDFKTYSNINKQFEKSLISVDEKLYFNNHSRLF
jgi:hypothetical protein